MGDFQWLWEALNPDKFPSMLQMLLTHPPDLHISKETHWRGPEEQSGTGRAQQKLWESVVPFPILLAAFIFSSVFIFPPVFQTFLWSCFLDLKHSGIAVFPHFCLEDNYKQRYVNKIHTQMDYMGKPWGKLWQWCKTHCVKICWVRRLSEFSTNTLKLFFKLTLSSNSRSQLGTL